jgi:hypothetical protein
LGYNLHSGEVVVVVSFVIKVVVSSDITATVLAISAVVVALDTVVVELTILTVVVVVGAAVVVVVSGKMPDPSSSTTFYDKQKQCYVSLILLVLHTIWSDHTFNHDAYPLHHVIMEAEKGTPEPRRTRSEASPKCAPKLRRTRSEASPNVISIRDLTAE